MKRLAIDWTLCDGHGLCARLLAERVAVDEWGFPFIDPRPLREDEEADVRRAVRACPRLALRIESVRSDPQHP